MGYIFRPEDAQHYHDWFDSQPGKLAVSLEKSLLSRIWTPPSHQRVLEVGCGTGVFLEWFAQQGHTVTGIDPSLAMLDIARKRLPGRISLERGFAENLPYENNEFDTVALITSLEFTDDPAQALREAVRVARRYVLLGAFNKFSIIASQHFVERLWKRTVFRYARFFSVFELEHMITDALSGTVPLKWRTCLTFPLATLPYLRFLERSRLFHMHPFGFFIAMRVDLLYPVQTIQEPLFCKVTTGMGPAPFRPSCWRSPQGKIGYNFELQDKLLITDTQTSTSAAP